MGPSTAVSTRLIFTTCLSFVDGARWVHASTRRPARGRVHKYTYSEFTNWRKMTPIVYTYRNYTHSTTLYKYGSSVTVIIRYVLSYSTFEVIFRMRTQQCFHLLQSVFTTTVKEDPSRLTLQCVFFGLAHAMRVSSGTRRSRGYGREIDRENHISCAFKSST